MKTLKSILAMSSLLVALSHSYGSVSTDTPSRAENWFSHYYQNPRPDDLVASAHQLSARGFFEQPGNTATAIGFFAEVFNQNPHRVREWLDKTSDLPDVHRRILAAAAWQSGSPRGLALMRELSANDDGLVRLQVNDLLRRGPSTVAETAVLSESSLRLQWGAFLATGSDRHVVAMLKALGTDQPDLTIAVRYALAESAANHSRVLEICRTELSRQPEAIRSEIRAALNAAKTGPGV